MCYNDSTQNTRNLYCFKDLYIGIIVLVVKRRGFFGHVFRFGFNGQYRKQIEQTGTVILTEMFLKEKMPRKALSKMSKAQIRRFCAPALLFSYLLSEKLIQRLAILTFPFRPTVRTCTEDEHSGRARRRKRHRFVQHIFAVYIGHVSVFQS